MTSNTSFCLPPIHTLNHDILWRIFSINAGLYWTTRTTSTDRDHRALTGLRRSSQVCRMWRLVVLESPTLWGMVLELDLLAQDDDGWRKLVLGRAKNAQLCINGTVRGGHPGSHAFFVSLLHNHWPRIRRFDVFVEDHYLFEADTWDVFQRPASQLEIFKLYFERDESTIFSASDCSIFSDDAPVLREFMFPDTSTTYFSLQAAWLKHLRSLVLSSAFKASEILDTLRELRSLEYLELRDSILETSDSDMPKACVPLPCLEKLCISNTVATSLFFLKHINLSPGASLFLLTEEHMDSRDTLSDQVIDELCTQITRYTQNYLSNTDYALAKSLFLKLGPPTFSCKVRRTADELIPMPFQNDFRIGVFSNHLPRHAVPRMVASLNPRQFTHTTRLEFIPYMVDIIEEAQPTFTILLQALSAVKVMMTSENGLKVFLNAHSEDPYRILPSMDTFWLKYIEPTTDRFPELFLRLLRGRRDVGRPILTVNISDSIYQFREKLDWGYLEEIEGLRVILRQDSGIVEEYVCGTGNPEKLNMRSRDL